MTDTKYCSKCKQDLPLSCFTPDVTHVTKYQRYCIECKTQTNASRMWVNGKHVSKKHPLYKPGRYRTLDDAWSHTEIDERSAEGEVYIIRNKAWIDWYKVGKAVSSEDRLQGYQTSSPFRDYLLEYCETFDNRHQAESAIHRMLEKHDKCFERRGEWFKTYIPVIKEVMNEYRNQEADRGHRDEHCPQHDMACSDAGC